MNQNGPNCSGKAAVMTLQLNAVLYPYRVLFEDAMSGFKILSCRCETEDVPIDPKYHSLTLKGSNLSILKIGDRADVVLEPIDDTRHPYGYRLVGYQGVNYESDRVELTPIAEMQSLTRIMTEQQAQNVHEAYPHFVAMILNGDDGSISHKNIYNVGPKLLPKYIQQIKAMHMEVQFISSASAWGIESSGDIQKISTRYDSVKDFDAAIAENPYAVLVDVLEWGFVKADKAICLRRSDFINSRERAEAASISILKLNEQDGNTRMTANALFEQFTKLAPQAIQHLYQAVTESPRIHYEPLCKLASLTSTYNAECLIADVLKKKIAHPHLLPMNWQEHINADGLSLTDEQAKILEMACSKDAMMLTGSAGCVDCDTEFFTGFGWKRIADYQDGDMVLQYNDDGTAELVSPIAYIKRPCNYLWHFETPHSINQTICDEHRILYKWSTTGKICETNVLALKEKSDNNIAWGGKFITQFYYYGRGMNLSDEQIRVMIAVMADGRYSTWGNEKSTSTHCHIRLKRQRKIVRLRELLSAANINYTEVIDKLGVTIFRFYAPERRKIYGGDWWNVNKHQAAIICDEVVKWDGSIIESRVNKLKKPCFWTTEKQSADYIQYIFTINGWQSTITADFRSLKPTYQVTTKLNQYSSLCFDTRSTKTKTKFTKVSTTDGHKYCFTVPSHMLVLRRKDCIFITGNCGKTASMQALVNMLDNYGYTYTLLAPTGISSKKLRESTQKEASTVHMFLTMSEDLGNYLIIDEASQINVHLLSMLFKKLNDDTKIIFIADPAQLASISCGNIVRDLLDSGVMPVANLTKVFRYNSSGIITLSTDVRNGRNEHLTDTYADYKFVPISTQAIKQIEEEYAALVSGGYDPSDVLILSPFNKGPVGSMAINAAIQAKFNPNPMSGIAYKRDGVEIGFKVGDMVINKKNEYSMPLDDGMDTAFVANGDIGTILAIDDVDCSMTVKFGCGICHVDRTHIQRLMLGYCISVHACQGSQAKAVMVVVDSSHGRMLSRNLLYTAMTRAQERLVVVGNVAAIEYGLGVQEEMERNTWLKELMMR